MLYIASYITIYHNIAHYSTYCTLLCTILSRLGLQMRALQADRASSGQAPLRPLLEGLDRTCGGKSTVMVLRSALISAG